MKPEISLDEVFRSLKKISTRITELLQLNREVQKQMTASMMLEIKDSTSPKSSPGIDVNKAQIIQVKSLDKLRKNYGVLNDLFDTKNELEAMEATLRTTKFSTASPDRALSEIAKMKKDVFVGISDAFAFITSLAKKHLPPKLEAFSRGVCSSVEKSLLYQEARVFTYLFEEGGDLYFTVYLQLRNAEDETGRIFPEIFLTMTYRVGADPQMFVGIQHHFKPPSADLLMKKVSSIKEALSAYSHLLELDDFSNTLGSLPIAVLLNPKSIVKDLFSVNEHIRSIEVEEMEISFHTKSSALPVLDHVVAQLFLELNSIQRRKNAKLRRSVRKSNNSATITFRFVMPNNAAPVDATDLDFLKDRFHLNDSSVKKIVRVINVGD